MSLFTLLTIGLSFLVVVALSYRAVPHGPYFLRSPTEKQKKYEPCLSSSLYMGNDFSKEFGKSSLIFWISLFDVLLTFFFFACVVL